MTKTKILIVEDDPHILTGLNDLLRQEGFEIYSTTNGEEALKIHSQKKPDLIVLDVMIPGKSGFDVCREIRKTDTQTAILFLSAKGQEIDKVLGLRLGADDYLAKPFGIHELVARVDAVLRRKQIKTPPPKSKEPITFGDVYINPKTMTGTKGKKTFTVSEREVALLHLLTSHENEVMDRDMILNLVWGINYGGTTRTLDQHIVKLRQKIEDDPADPKYIQTVHGMGYKFNK